MTADDATKGEPTLTLTADLIAEALSYERAELTVQPAEGWTEEGWNCEVSLIHRGDGVLTATLWDNNYDENVPVETRTYRLVRID